MTRKLVFVLALTILMAWVMFDFVLKLSKLLLIPFKEGLSKSCYECEYFGICKGLTVWYNDMCELQMKHSGINS